MPTFVSFWGGGGEVVLILSLIVPVDSLLLEVGTKIKFAKKLYSLFVIVLGR